MNDNLDKITHFEGKKANTPKVKSLYNEIIAREIKFYQDNSIKIPPLLEKCTQIINDETTKYFNKFDIKIAGYPKFFYLNHNAYGKNPGNFGTYIPSAIAVREVREPELARVSTNKNQIARMENINLCAAACSYAHEVFHSTGLGTVMGYLDKPRGLNKIFSKEKLRIIETSRGLGFGKFDYEERGHAVEDRLAVLFEIQMESTIEKIFPREIKFFRETRHVVLNKIGPESNIPLESICIYGVDEELRRKGAIFEYPNSINLVKFLKNHVPEFGKLAMRARTLRNKKIPLARVIYQRFGKSVNTGEDLFTKIMMATEENAYEIQNELENLIRKD